MSPDLSKEKGTITIGDVSWDCRRIKKRKEEEKKSEQEHVDERRYCHVVALKWRKV